MREPTGWYKGKPGGYVQRYSDNLLMFEVKRQIPEYRDRWELTGAGGQPLQVTVAAYHSEEGPNKGYTKPTPLPKEENPRNIVDSAIEVEAKDVE